MQAVPCGVKRFFKPCGPQVLQKRLLARAEQHPGEQAVRLKGQVPQICVSTSLVRSWGDASKLMCSKASAPALRAPGAPGWPACAR